jgi:hypothetical protein
MGRDSSLSSLGEAADFLSESLAATENQIYGILRASQIHLCKKSGIGFKNVE